MISEQEADSLIETIYETDKYGSKYIRYDRKPNEDLVEFYKNKYAINTDCHHSCHTCQINQIYKYKGDLEAKNRKSIEKIGQPLEKWFPIKCSYIQKGLPAHFKDKMEELKKTGMDEKKVKRMMLASIDPVSWAELMFGFDNDSKLDPNIEKHWYIRWYQVLTLRCTAKNMVLRQGRRSGKSAISMLKVIDLVFNKKVYKGKNSDTGEIIESGPAIAIITPFQSQISALFDEIENFVKRNKDIEKQVVPRGSKLYKQTPPMQMDFKNGASIVGFVTGSNNKEDGSGGGSIRGAISADIVYMDEMDMIPESIFKKVIEPLGVGKPSVTFMGSSTPIGKKGTFWKWCNESPNYKEIYFPSTVLPHWHMVEEDAINEGGQDSFRAEYLAEFITDSYGVFKNEYIVAARTDYKYHQTQSRTFWSRFGEDPSQFIVCMGIDWNKKIGTEYSIIAFSPKTTDFWILENFVLPPSQYSSNAYKEMTKELNYKYNPKFIYADEGYGHMIIETLQLESALAEAEEYSPQKAFDVALGSKLKTINFSSNIELYNPVTGTYFKKYTKNFLVENAVQIFERGKIHFAEGDTVLTKQLGNYIEIGKQDSGKVVYGMESETIGDHRLDAVMLALGGLVKEESLFSANYTNDTGTFFKERIDATNEGFTSAIKQANELKALMLRNKTSMNYSGIVLSRGRTEQQEREAYYQKAHALGIEVNGKHSRSINTELAEKGFFGEKGAVDVSVPREATIDPDDLWKYSKPSMVKRRPTGSIRTTNFGKK